jgi:perosamine synthetase
MNLDLSQVADAIGPRTRAVIGVHLFGRPLDWDGLRAVVPRTSRSSRTPPARWERDGQGRACGSLGALGCLSFHPRKIVTTGEGRRRHDRRRRARRFDPPHAHHGIEPRGDFEIRAPGPNYRLADILCAVGIPQVRRLDELLAARTTGRGRVHGAPRGRRRRRRRRTKATCTAGRRTSCSSTAATRRFARSRAGDRGADRHVRAAPLAAYADQGSFPGADRAYERALALPFHTRLTDAELDRVADALRAFA